MKANVAILFIILGIGCKTDCSLGQYSSERVVITKVCDLPKEAVESSGIIFFQGLVWTFNDSDNGAVIYGIDTITGELVKEVIISGVENVDWEAISQDEENIYIADNGNNKRVRIDYSIYVLAKDSISNNKKQILTPSHIIKYNFREEDLNKIDFNSINVDSEAILVDGDSLFIYIKDWLYAHTSVFSIPLNKDSVEGNLRGTFELGYAVTAATRINSRQLAFLGYKDYRSYLSILEASPQLSGNVTQLAHLELLELQGYQTEGLTYENGRFYISCERQLINQALFRLEFK